MTGIFDQFRRKIITSVWQEAPDEATDNQVDDLIALGVLLWTVAEADERFLPEERTHVSEVLQNYGDIEDQDLSIVMRAVEEASIQRIDLHTFTKEVCHELEREVKIEILENLFRVACIDQELDEKEHEAIRQIANLFQLDHEEFIKAKIKIKKEFGLDTAGL